MANGCVEQRITAESFREKTTDEKLDCLWDVMAVMQEDVRKLKKWSTVKIISGAFAGGAFAIIALIILGVKVM